MTAAEYLEALADQEGAAPRKKRQRPEDELQIQCNTWLEVRALASPMPLNFMFHPANGGFRTPAEAGRFKAMGVKTGTPDWVCPIPWRGWAGLAIEMKAPKGRGPRKNQKAWLDALEGCGYLVATCRSLDHFISLVEQYVKGRGSRPT